MAAFNFSVAASFFALDTGEAGGLICRGDEGCTTPLLLGLDGCAEIGPRGGGPVVWLVSDGGISPSTSGYCPRYLFKT